MQKCVRMHCKSERSWQWQRKLFRPFEPVCLEIISGQMLDKWESFWPMEGRREQRYRWCAWPFGRMWCEHQALSCFLLISHLHPPRSVRWSFYWQTGPRVQRNEVHRPRSQVCKMKWHISPSWLDHEPMVLTLGEKCLCSGVHEPGAVPDGRHASRDVRVDNPGSRKFWSTICIIFVGGGDYKQSMILTILCREHGAPVFEGGQKQTRAMILFCILTQTVPWKFHPKKKLVSASLSCSPGGWWVCSWCWCALFSPI